MVDVDHYAEARSRLQQAVRDARHSKIFPRIRLNDAADRIYVRVGSPDPNSESLQTDGARLKRDG
jgi:hypothetical protein